MPTSMPLAEVYLDRGVYGTTLSFAQCGSTDIGGTPPCAVDSASMRVQIWPSDDYSGQIDEERAVLAEVGGRDAIYLRWSHR